jgi:hypothetical protein
MATRTTLPLSDPQFDRIASYIDKGFPGACILWIDKINNDKLLTRYLDKKERFGDNAKELQLFHGTKTCVDDICIHGFKVSLNVTSAHGKGTYFGDTAATAFPYMRQGNNRIVYMFVCKVLSTGFTLNRMPRKNGNVTVCNLSKPCIYCVPEDDSILPEYVVAFDRAPRK